MPLPPPPPQKKTKHIGTREQVRLADAQVAAAWHDVMSPPQAPVPGEPFAPAGGAPPNTATIAAATSSGSASAATTAPTERGATSADAASAGESSGGADGSVDDADATAAAAASAGEGGVMTFEIEAGDGLTEDDAADLTAILREVRRYLCPELSYPRRGAREEDSAVCVVPKTSRAPGSSCLCSHVASSICIRQAPLFRFSAYFWFSFSGFVYIVFSVEQDDNTVVFLHCRRCSRRARFCRR